MHRAGVVAAVTTGPSHSDPRRGFVILTFLAPSMRRPVGGAAMIYEFATAMADRGHEVHVVHLDIFGSVATSANEIEWFDLDDGVEHHFLGAGPYDPSMAPRADIIFGFSPEAAPEAVGLPVVFIQGYRMLSEQRETSAFHAPCPKICVARWLVDVGRDLGVPAQQLVHVPLGLRHDVFRLTTPIGSRSPVVSFCFNPHAQKGARDAFEALGEVRERVPELRVLVFGSTRPAHQIPEWMEFRLAPEQTVLVEDIYNRSQVFMMPSIVEGFGLPAAEAMACGAALVTTDNGGSRDYARHGETALVSPPGDVGSLVEHTMQLLEDDTARIDLAEAGYRFVQRFSWPASAARLERFLEEYRAAPDRYR